MASEHTTESGRDAGTSRRPLVLGLALIAAAAAVILGFRFLGGALFSGDGASTPEALFEDLRRLGAAGEWHATWTRVHPDELAQFRRAIDESRVFLERNPGATELGTKQFHCTYDEFKTLPYRELYARASRGMESSLSEARIVRTEPAPDVPGDVFVYWVNSFGDDESMRARKSGDGQWYVIKLTN